MLTKIYLHLKSGFLMPGPDFPSYHSFRLALILRSEDSSILKRLGSGNVKVVEVNVT